MDHVERFWSKVRKIDGDCWEWVASKGWRGHGRFSVDGKLLYAHRFSYELAHGDIPGGLQVRHSCDNPGCVNPDHLLLGTHADNMRDRKERGGSKFIPQEVIHGKRRVNNSGELNGRSKLTNNDVKEIRYLLDNTNTRQRDLVRRFGVSSSRISDIKNRKSWKSL